MARPINRRDTKSAEQPSRNRRELRIEDGGWRIEERRRSEPKISSPPASMLAYCIAEQPSRNQNNLTTDGHRLTRIKGKKSVFIGVYPWLKISSRLESSLDDCI